MKEPKEWSPDDDTTERHDGETFSFFTDDDVLDGAVYSGVVYLDGATVRVRELTAAEMEAHEKLEAELAQRLGGLAGVSADKVDGAVKEIQAAQIAIYDHAITLAVSGWDLKRPNGKAVPYNAANLKLLRASKRALLCQKIIQRSQMGRDLTDFLGVS